MSEMAFMGSSMELISHLFGIMMIITIASACVVIWVIAMSQQVQVAYLLPEGDEVWRGEDVAPAMDHYVKIDGEIYEVGEITHGHKGRLRIVLKEHT